MKKMLLQMTNGFCNLSQLYVPLSVKGVFKFGVEVGVGESIEIAPLV
jgi:hypothetical protein